MTTGRSTVAKDDNRDSGYWYDSRHPQSFNSTSTPVFRYFPPALKRPAGVESDQRPKRMCYGYDNDNDRDHTPDGLKPPMRNRHPQQMVVSSRNNSSTSHLTGAVFYLTMDT